MLRQPVWQALAFAFTVFMLQSGSYWGEQYVFRQKLIGAALPPFILSKGGDKTLCAR